MQQRWIFMRKQNEGSVTGIGSEEAIYLFSDIGQ